MVCEKKILIKMCAEIGHVLTGKCDFRKENSQVDGHECSGPTGTALVLRQQQRTMVWVALMGLFIESL